MFDQVLKQFGLGDKAGDLVGMLAQQMQAKGGLDGLLKQFHGAGLGDQASSWVSTGENQPINAEQAKAALGPEFIEQAAAKLGIPQDQAGEATAAALPQLVDKLTPNGQVEQGQDLMGALQGMLGGQMPNLGNIGGMLGGLMGGDKK